MDLRRRYCFAAGHTMYGPRSLADRIFGYDIFISYARSDASRYAAALKRDLEQRGFRCFLDKVDFPAGSELRAGLERDLARSQAAVVVASPAGRASQYVALEVATYRRRRPHRRLLPISIERTLDDAPAG